MSCANSAPDWFAWTPDSCASTARGTPARSCSGITPRSGQSGPSQCTSFEKNDRRVRWLTNPGGRRDASPGGVPGPESKLDKLLRAEGAAGVSRAAEMLAPLFGLGLGQRGSPARRAVCLLAEIGIQAAGATPLISRAGTCSSLATIRSEEYWTASAAPESHWGGLTSWQTSVWIVRDWLSRVPQPGKPCTKRNRLGRVGRPKRSQG